VAHVQILPPHVVSLFSLPPLQSHFLSLSNDHSLSLFFPYIFHRVDVVVNCFFSVLGVRDFPFHHHPRRLFFFFLSFLGQKVFSPLFSLVCFGLWDMRTEPPILGCLSVWPHLFCFSSQVSLSFQQIPFPLNKAPDYPPHKCDPLPQMLSLLRTPLDCCSSVMAYYSIQSHFLPDHPSHKFQ